MNKNFNPSIYFVADPSLCAGGDVARVVVDAIQGGVTLIQFRDKNSSSSQVLRYVKLMQRAIGGRVPLIINDHVEIAKEVDADGVHLGQGDMDAVEARAILGNDKIIGVTAFTEDQVAAVDPAVVDYIGMGPFYETQTDKGKPVLGAERFAALAALSPVPVVGIGGITPDNAAVVIAAGADGVAMMRSVSEADDPQIVVQKFKEVLNGS